MYRNIRHGERVPDKELDQVASWLKLSGVVCRRDGVLRVRNAVYEHVFDEQWARDHLRLNVNWRRRLTGLAAGLLVLTVLVTIPLAVYAWRQKIEAEYQARQAELQRDDANRQRVIAEKSLRDRLAAFGNGGQAARRVEALQPVICGGHRSPDRQRTSGSSEGVRRIDDSASRGTRRRLAQAGEREPGSGGARRPGGGIDRDDRECRSPQSASQRLKNRPTSRSCFACTKQPTGRKTWRRYDACRCCRRQKPKPSEPNLRTLSDDSTTVDKADIRVSADGRSAAVTAEVRRIVTTGSRVSTVNALKVFTLEKRRNGWIIVSVR